MSTPDGQSWEQYPAVDSDQTFEQPPRPEPESPPTQARPPARQPQVVNFRTVGKSAQKVTFAMIVSLVFTVGVGLLVLAGLVTRRIGLIEGAVIMLMIMILGGYRTLRSWWKRR